MRELPLFPLNTVLFPGGWLPLHIFEPRYRQMVARCLESPEREFVVLLIKAGDEVVERPQPDAPRGTPAVPFDTGTIAQIVEARPLPDGRSFVVCHGRQRVRLGEIVQERPYLVGRVSLYPDADAGSATPALHERAGQVRRAAERLLAALEAALPKQARDQRAQLQALAAAFPLDATQLSCFVPRLLGGASAEEQQVLLEAPSAQRRLELTLPLLFREQQVVEHLRALDRGAPPSPGGDSPFGRIRGPSLN